jgi:hopene-associated glycosyltransferase HpnB
MLAEDIITYAVAAAWLYLILFHGRYWELAQRLPVRIPVPDIWPSVVAIVPARNEADVIAETVARHEAQNYPGDYRIIVVNDRSEDGTGEVARAAAGPRTTVIEADERPEGWMGKVWAMEQGLLHMRSLPEKPEFILFTDADIHHPVDSVSRLVAFAEFDKRDLVSLMVMLKVETFWEKLLIPAFVLFFAKLYPFRKVNNPHRRAAAAAGGCMLVRRESAEWAGLAESIKGELIDDCALAKRIKTVAFGRLWLGLAEDIFSARAYGGLNGIWAMVTRTAFTQLRFSPFLLCGSVLGMILLYLAPPVLMISDMMGGETIVFSVGAFVMMTVSFSGAMALYRSPLYMRLLLPLAAVMYTAMTIDSALRHWRGQGGGWKGRYQAKDGL